MVPRRRGRIEQWRWSVGILATATASLLTTVAKAAPPDSAPARLVAAVEAIEAAANARDLDRVMAFYAPNFQGADGFTRDTYAETLSRFWAQYAELTYDVELLSWEAAERGVVAETLTTVTGVQRSRGQERLLTATLRSRQRYEGDRIVSQEILSEQARLITGSNPPTVDIHLPETVTPGSTFSFDAIVKEPVGNRVLLGLALDEGVTSEDFLTPRPLDLQNLTAGGLFKLGKAPATADQRWISSVIVRNDGMVIDTRRMRVQPPR